MPDFKPSRVIGDVTAEIDSTVPVTVNGIAVVTFDVTGAVTNIADNTKTTIVTASYTLGTFENIAIISVSGDDYAKFFFTVNGTDIAVKRTGPDRNLEFNFTGAPYALQSGDIVDIKVEHFRTGQLLNFDATIYGYT